MISACSSVSILAIQKDNPGQNLIDPRRLNEIRRLRCVTLEEENRRNLTDTSFSALNEFTLCFDGVASAFTQIASGSATARNHVEIDANTDALERLSCRNIGLSYETYTILTDSRQPSLLTRHMHRMLFLACTMKLKYLVERGEQFTASV